MDINRIEIETYVYYLLFNKKVNVETDRIEAEAMPLGRGGRMGHLTPPFCWDKVWHLSTKIDIEESKWDKQNSYLFAF